VPVTTGSVPPGLCARCVFRRDIASRTGSTFVYCRKADDDARFPRYPNLPVLVCGGYQPRDARDTANPDDTRR